MVARQRHEPMISLEQVGRPSPAIDAPNLPHRLEEGDGGGRNVWQHRIGTQRLSRSGRRPVPKPPPDLRVNGVTVEPRQVLAPIAANWMVGVLHDPVFGPVISFMPAANNVEIFRDRAALPPPLNRAFSPAISSTRPGSPRP